MNTTYILVNTKRYPYHRNILSILADHLFPNDTDISIIDLSQSNISALGQHLDATAPDLVITLDLSGFEIRTYTGECFLNILPSKICNIIWGNKPEYSKYLNGKLSLSMLFYDATGINHELSSVYPYLRYYYSTMYPIASTQINDSASETIEALKALWNHFIKEVLI